MKNYSELTKHIIFYPAEINQCYSPGDALMVRDCVQLHLSLHTSLSKIVSPKSLYTRQPRRRAAGRPFGFNTAALKQHLSIAGSQPSESVTESQRNGEQSGRPKGTQVCELAGMLLGFYSRILVTKAKRLQRRKAQLSDFTI